MSGFCGVGPDEAYNEAKQYKILSPACRDKYLIQVQKKSCFPKSKTPNSYVGGFVVGQGLTSAFATDMDIPGERLKRRYLWKQENG